MIGPKYGIPYPVSSHTPVPLHPEESMREYCDCMVAQLRRLYEDRIARAEERIATLEQRSASRYQRVVEALTAGRLDELASMGISTDLATSLTYGETTAEQSRQK